MNGDFEAILKLLQNSKTLILDKVWHIAIAANCHLSFKLSTNFLSTNFLSFFMAAF